MTNKKQHNQYLAIEAAIQSYQAYTGEHVSDNDRSMINYIIGHINARKK